MVSILPNFDEENNNFSSAQVWIYAVERYILIGLYTFLLVLTIVNIWSILIKQGKYKTWLLLAFYIYAFVNITFRVIWLIMEWCDCMVFLHYINDFFLITKLSIGLVQSWMIFEIALRVRQTYQPSAFNAAAKAASFEKWVRCGQLSTITVSFAIVLVIFVDDLCT